MKRLITKKFQKIKNQNHQPKMKINQKDNTEKENQKLMQTKNYQKQKKSKKNYQKTQMTQKI